MGNAPPPSACLLGAGKEAEKIAHHPLPAHISPKGVGQFAGREEAAVPHRDKGFTWGRTPLDAFETGEVGLARRGAQGLDER